MEKRLDYIDALRGFAILGVLIVHTSLMIMPDSLKAIAVQGARGVQLFYVASSLTMFYTLKYSHAAEKYIVANFFIRRFFRIAPLFYLAMVFFLLKDGLGPRYWLGDAPGITTWNILATALFVNGWNPYWITSIVPGGWSIAVEMTFYLFVPMLFKRITNVVQAGWLFVGSLLLYNFLTMILSNHQLISSSDLWANYLFLWFPSQLPVFCLGISLFFLIDKIPAMTNGQKRNVALLLLSFAVIIMVFTVRNPTDQIIPYHIIFGVSFVFFAAALALHPFKLFVNKLTTGLGKLSYSCYITHFAVLSFVSDYMFVPFTKLGIIKSNNTLFLLSFVIVTMLTVAVSLATYTLLERPGINLGKKIINHLETSTRHPRTNNRL